MLKKIGLGNIGSSSPSSTTSTTISSTTPSNENWFNLSTFNRKNPSKSICLKDQFATRISEVKAQYPMGFTLCESDYIRFYNDLYSISITDKAAKHLLDRINQLIQYKKFSKKYLEFIEIIDQINQFLRFKNKCDILLNLVNKEDLIPEHYSSVALENNLQNISNWERKNHCDLDQQIDSMINELTLLTYDECYINRGNIEFELGGLIYFIQEEIEEKRKAYLLPRVNK